MQIDLDRVSRDDFNISARQHPTLGPVVLVTPDKGKHRWQDHELHLRSLLLRPDGQILSMGFPKFKNHGEDPLHDERTQRALHEGRVHFAHKEDGSLIIRSVVEGQVLLRTRGSHELGEFHPHVMGVAPPGLLDPQVGEVHHSHLFEFLSPATRVVLDPGHPRLVYLGRVEHPPGAAPRVVGGPEEVGRWAERFGVEPVRFYGLPTALGELLAAVRAWTEAEGVVAWCPQEEGGVHLSKIKASRYLQLHALRFAFTEERLSQYCALSGIQSEQQLAEALHAQGLDWELVSELGPVFAAWQRRLEGARARVAALELAVAPLAGLSRKEMALGVKELTEPGRPHAGLFPVGLDHLLGEQRSGEHSLALALGLSLRQWQQLRRDLRPAELLRAPAVDDG